MQLFVCLAVGMAAEVKTVEVSAGFVGTQRLHSIYCQLLNFLLILFCFRVNCFCISMYRLRGIEKIFKNKRAHKLCMSTAVKKKEKKSHVLI